MDDRPGEKENAEESRNVTAGDLIVAVLVIAAGCTLLWLEETGFRLAGFILAIIPAIGALYYLSLPAEKRKIDNSKLSRRDKRNLKLLKVGGIAIVGLLFVMFLLDLLF